MLQPTLITWVLVTFGLVLIFLPMLYAQLLMALRPNSRKAKDIIIGKGEEWRDKTHFNMAYGLAWADIIIWLPLLVAGNIGVILGYAWGYALWAAAGVISVYTQSWHKLRFYLIKIWASLKVWNFSVSKESSCCLWVVRVWARHRTIAALKAVKSS